MSGVPARLGMFGAVLVAIFGIAAGVGAVVKPSHPSAPARGGSMKDMAGVALGLSVSDERYTITPATFSAVPGGPTRLVFRIADRHGRVVRDGFEVEAERRLHLIVARRDLRGYQHLHPAEAADGTWSVELTLADPGVYRLFADFQIDGQKHVLGADLTVPGAYRPAALAAPSPTATVEGYTVRLATPTLRRGKETDLEFAVNRDGKPVRGLQPYLGAMGHLVALREGDLGYLHVHPHARSEATGVIPFAAKFPAAGNYRLFLQFRTNGTVHTTSFTVRVTA